MYMSRKFKNRRSISILITVIVSMFAIFSNPTPVINTTEIDSIDKGDVLAISVLQDLHIKGRAPKTDYSRDKFGSGWVSEFGCDTRNIILNRDLSSVDVDDTCNVTSGILNDPYTGKIINFLRGSDTSSLVQIDHVVALSDAWQKGAQMLSQEERIEFANDPLELLAVSGSSNQQKSDGDAATWLPSNKSFRCQYVARQIAVKRKYNLWVTEAEYDSMYNILLKCPDETLPLP